MANPKSSKMPLGGGFILAIGTIGGALYGASRGQPTIGFLAGFGAAAVIAVLIWLATRGR